MQFAETVAMNNALPSSDGLYGHHLEHDTCTERFSRWQCLWCLRLTQLAPWPQISLMDPDDPPDNSIPNPVDTGPALGDEEVCQG